MSNPGFDLRVTIDERAVSVLTSIAQSLELLLREREHEAAKEADTTDDLSATQQRQNVYHEALALARKTRRGYLFASGYAASKGFDVTTPALREWARAHGCRLPHTRTPAQVALFQAKAAAMRQAKAAHAAKPQVAQPSHNTPRPERPGPIALSIPHDGKNLVPPPEVEVSAAFARRWGADRGLDASNIAGINAVRAKLGLQKFVIEAA